MANLVCWASGLLEILKDKDTPMDGGPIVLAHGSAEYMRGLMVAHGEARAWQRGLDTEIDWYVPGCKVVPLDGAEAAHVQRDNMTLVIAFNERIARARTGGRK